MQSTAYPTLEQEELKMDYKQFIREFERYRNVHPDQSVTQALDTFVEQSQTEAAEQI